VKKFGGAGVRGEGVKVAWNSEVVVGELELHIIWHNIIVVIRPWQDTPFHVPRLLYQLSLVLPFSLPSLPPFS
jgi:hypothetical protein